MKIDVNTLEDTKARFVVEDTNPYFVNALRRILLSEIPKLAVSHVTIYDNTSPLFDEIISHRLGLIPLPMQQDVLVFRDECECEGEGCANCTVRYTLSKEGPGTVYSGDLQPEEKSWAVVDPNIPIVELEEDQRLILEVEACLGRGKDHSKWQPVHGAGYKYYPIIEIDVEKCNAEECKECVESCPRDILEIKKNKVQFKKNALEECSLCRACVEACENDAIQVKGDENKILFHFETDGSYTAEDALNKALNILKNKYDEFGKQLKEL